MPVVEQAQPSATVPVPQPVLGTHAPFMHIIPGLQDVPFATAMQVPAGPHCWQVGQPETVQQRLLTQLPVEQSPAPEQVSPGLSLHMPPATQVRVPVHVSSSPLVTVLHEPAVLPQLWQVPLQAEAQQRWSVHWPVTQSVPNEQAWPCLILHAPLESQIWVPEQLPSGSSAPVIATQVPPPPVQALHVPHVLLVQHRPSTQLPVVHSLPAVHASPGLFLQLPALSHVRVPEQLPFGSSAPVTSTHVPLAPVHCSHVPHAAAAQQRPSTQ
jgi:hypothetical protein